jgi:hypothetical protein
MEPGWDPRHFVIGNLTLFVACAVLEVDTSHSKL